MTMSMPAAWAADELKLPETPDEYRQLLMESSKSENEGRSGKVYHIAQVSTVVKAQAVAPNPTVTNAVGGSPGVQPVPLIGKNLDRAKEKDSRKMGYQIAVRWSDGSIGVFEQEDLNGLREGDPVVVHGQSVERDPSR
jgi:hypothetical protein